MASVRNGIENSFEELGVSYDKSIIDKCVDLCLDHGISDADELVDSWMAYTVSHLQGDNPSLQHLARFEREVLAKRKGHHRETTSETTHKINDLDSCDLLTAYDQTPRRNRLTPDVGNLSRVRKPVSPRGAFSPASYSPIVGTPSAKYNSRKNSGSILCERPITSEEDLLKNNVSVKTLNFGVPPELKYMSFNLTDYADSVDKKMKDLITQLSKRYSLEDIQPIRTQHPTSIVIAGRVVCDADGKANAESLLLEANTDDGGVIVKMDLSNIPNYALFPGQVIAMEGINVAGNKIVGKAVFTDASLPTPPPALNLRGAIKMMVACGPFTPTDSLTYQPLMDFMEVVVKEEPHVLLLTGPLLDSQHPALADGLITETFEDMTNRLLDQILEPLTGLNTEVVFVTSYRECQGAMVYPTPPLKIPPRHKLTVLPDPCLFDIEGFLIAATTVDILMHIGKEEVAFPPHTGDRLGRLASHIIQQQSFYPLRPPASGLPLDPTIESHLSLTKTPHLLILPSDLRCFIKDLHSCTVLNPEHLSKGLIGGTYGKIVIAKNGNVTGQIVKV